MHGCLSNLVPVGLFGALVATAVVPYMVARQFFGFSDAAAGLLGAGSLGVTLFLLFVWLRGLQKKENMVRATLQHPVFGEVKLYSNRWEAMVPLVPGGEAIEVGDTSTGGTIEPTPVDEAAFLAIRERWPELHNTCVQAVNDFLKSAGKDDDGDLAPLTRKDLVLEQVMLGGEKTGDFWLGFGTPEDRFWWGVTIVFEDFKVVEVSDNH